MVCEILVRHKDGSYLLMQRDWNKTMFAGFYGRGNHFLYVDGTGRILQICGYNPVRANPERKKTRTL